MRRVRDYDALAVVPRLGALQVPALLVVAEHDPIVPRAVVEPGLRGIGSAVELLHLRRGGHVSFLPAARVHAAVIRFFQNASTRAR